MHGTRRRHTHDTVDDDADSTMNIDEIKGQCSYTKLKAHLEREHTQDATK